MFNSREAINPSTPSKEWLQALVHMERIGAMKQLQKPCINKDGVYLYVGGMDFISELIEWGYEDFIASQVEGNKKPSEPSFYKGYERRP